MKKTIIAFSFLFVVFSLITIISSCKKEKNNPPISFEPTLRAFDASLTPYKIGLIIGVNMKFTQTDYNAEFGGSSLVLKTLNDTTLNFTTPDLTPGSYKMVVSINNKLFTLEYLVVAGKSITDPVQYVTTILDEFTATKDLLNERIDTMAARGLINSASEKNILNTINDSLNYYNQQFQLLSTQDQAKAASLIAANTSDLDVIMADLGPLTDDISGQSFYKKNGACDINERSGRMNCLMVQYNRIANINANIDKLNSILGILLLPISGWEKTALKILTYNYSKVDDQYYLVGFELASRPYHPISISLNNAPTSFNNYQSKSIGINLIVRNVKETPDANDKYWEKDFSKNFNKLIKDWNSTAWSLFTNNPRKFPILIQPQLLPENTDVVLDINNTNSNVTSSSVLGTPQNMSILFGTTQSTSQNFTYTIKYDDAIFSLETNPVNASVIVSGTTPPVTDIDGNTYNTVQIGSQIWMKENLKTTRYRNGAAITTGLNNYVWQNPNEAYAVYDSNYANNTIYGKLYNWHAVTDSRNLCPTGWHIPSNNEWTTLIDTLGGASVAGGKMKSQGTQYWNTPNQDATNESGFTALPGGARFEDGTYSSIKGQAYFWSSTAIDVTNAKFYGMESLSGTISSYDGMKIRGQSVRCIKD